MKFVTIPVKVLSVISCKLRFVFQDKEGKKKSRNKEGTVTHFCQYHSFPDTS